MKEIKLFCLGILLSVSSLFSETTVIDFFNPTEGGVTQINKTSYSGTGLGIGTYVVESGSEEDTCIERRYFIFDLTSIDDRATITSVTLYTFMDESGYKYNLNKLTTLGSTASTQWGQIANGTLLHSGLDYGSDLMESSTLKTAVVNALSSNQLIVGALSQSEATIGSYSSLTITIEVEYTLPTLNMTVRNDLYGEDGGDIGVGIYPLSASSHSSPYVFVPYEGDRLELEAYDNQTVHGKTWFFNNIEYPVEISSWEKMAGGNTNTLSHAQSFITGDLGANDNNAEISAFLKSTTYTTTGELSSNEFWLLSSNTLTGDISVPNNVTLTIGPHVTVNLNNHKITSTGGSIVVDENSQINPNIQITNSNNAVLGLYSTIESARSNATIGQDINILSDCSLAANIIIPNGVTLVVGNDSELNLGTYTITGEVEVEATGKLNPYICVDNTVVDKYFPNTSSAVSYISDPWDIMTLDGDYTLTQDLTVESYSLVIGSKSDLNMNGYNLTIDWANDGNLNSLSSSAKFSPDLRLLSGTTVLGFYGSLSDAYSDGSVVELRDTLVSTGNLTVPSGKTLRTLTNSVMKMPSGYNLDVYGTLNATSSSFLSTSTIWGGIEFMSGSGGTVNACYFKDASLAMNVNYASPTIHDVAIEDCGYGIRIYGSTSNPNVYDNTIWDCSYGLYVRSTGGYIHGNGVYDCSTYGLYLYNTSSNVYDNEVENARVYMNSCFSTLTNNYIHGTTSSGYTMYIYNSEPYFFNNTITAEDDYTIQTSNSTVWFGQDGWNGPPDCYGLNVLDNDESNDGVIYATNGSDVILGGYDVGLYDCGHNSIYNRNYPLWTDGSSTIFAWDCYWGDDDAPDCVGDVEIGDELDEDPDDVGSSLAKSTRSSDLIIEFSCVEDSLYHYARELIVESNYSLALTVLEEIITDYQESNYAYRALNLSIRLCDKFEVASTSEWLTTLSNEVSNDDLSEIIDLKRVSNYHKSGKVNEAIALSESISDKGNNKHEVSTLFNLFNFYQKDKGDIDEAEKYFEKLKEKYPDHELTLIACSDMNDDNYDESLAKALTNSDDMTEEVVLPETFKVHAAYPNPFNPSTTLEFDLPVSAKVECSIFDLRGNLINNYKYNKQAGTHHIIWNGANIPSGIYLIRFVAEASNGSETFVDYQKVTLLK